MTTYRLASSSFMYTPGVVAWAQNGYKFPKDRDQMLNVMTTAFPTVPPLALEALLRQEVLHRIEDETLVFEAYVKAPVMPETEEEYFYALEGMPPSRFQRVNAVEMFHICEHLTDNLVNWHAAYNGKYFQFNDEADANATALAGRVRIALL